MAVILGGSTQVAIGGQVDGFQSVQWSIQVQNNRLWQIGPYNGGWNPYKTQVQKTLTVNVSAYAGAITAVSLGPSSDCTDSDASKSIQIVPAACGASIGSFNETGMFIMSYSYSKGDPNAFGTESWSFQKWVASEVGETDIIDTAAPSAVIQGITEGNYTADDGLNVGIVFTGAQEISGFQGDISAGFPGLGQANTITYGIVEQIGGGDLEGAGKVGNSSASIPHQPIYV